MCCPTDLRSLPGFTDKGSGVFGEFLNLSHEPVFSSEKWRWQCYTRLSGRLSDHASKGLFTGPDRMEVLRVILERFGVCVCVWWLMCVVFWED